MARLRIEFRGVETDVSLKREETTVGRSNRCTIHLPDPELAEVHFRIQPRKGGYRLKDDGSGSGTRVNGKTVFATGLKHGDVIEAGGLRCRFLSKAAAPPPPAAAAPPPVAPPVAEPPPPNRTSLYVGVAAAVLVAGALAFFLLRESPEKEAARRFQAARAIAKDSEDEATLRRYAKALEEVVAEFDGTKVAASAALELASAQRTLRAFEEIEALRGRLGDDLTEEEAGGLRKRLARLEERAGAAVLRRLESVRAEISSRLLAREERAFAAADERARALVAEKRFAEALHVWRDFETPDFTYRRRAEEARAAIEKAAATEYRALLRLAGGSQDLEAKIGLFEASRPVFRGTRQADDLEVRISALRARQRQKTIVVLDRPEPKGKTPETKEPEEFGPYEDPPEVAALVKVRRYAEAAKKLNQLSRHPATPVRVEELTLLARMRADLVEAVKARPVEFQKILLPEGGRADATDADDDSITLMQDGAKRKFAWEELPAKSFDRLFRTAGFEKPPRLAVALFFDEEGLLADANSAYVAFFKSEQSPTTFTRILARRRGIPEPLGGFLLFRGAIVTPEEQEQVLFAERLEQLGKQARATVDSRRNEAWDELQKIGGPALEILAGAIRERRDSVALELQKSRAFTPQRFVARFGRELEQRRKDALAFILDAQKYPYPNKTDAAQAEAERLVNRVRELWEQPYAVLLEGSDQAQELDRDLQALDQRLAVVDPLDEPRYAEVVEGINGGFVMREIAIDGSDRKRIDYNLAVEKYNAALETSADEEERANVKAVNRYRWMMGLRSVKIDERLVRAARKHSIEMQQLNYFAHDSPTPHLKSPGHRTKREGYPGGAWENIALGAATGEQAFWQWFKSSGHHRNMLDPGHTDLGCGSAMHHWWTQNFGRATGRSLDPPRVPPDPDPPGESGNGRPAPGKR